MNLKLSLSIALLLLATDFGIAAQKKPATKGKAPAVSAAEPSAKSTVNPLIAAQSKARSKALKAEKAKASKVAPVDINHASKDELKKVPGITDAYADKIIKGRPYLTKAHLVTHDIITAGLYDSIKKRIYAGKKAQTH